MSEPSSAPASTAQVDSRTQSFNDSLEDDKPAIVLLHGVFGYGEHHTPLWGAAPHYFPINELRSQTSKVIVAPSLGSHSSNHDRACEAFAQLMGLLTDYGEAHSVSCGHCRYGEDHRGEPMLDLWDASHPIHIIGHSFGGNTALVLLTLLAQDYWGYGTSAAWVSCTAKA